MPSESLQNPNKKDFKDFFGFKTLSWKKNKQKHFLSDFKKKNKWTNKKTEVLLGS